MFTFSTFSYHDTVRLGNFVLLDRALKLDAILKQEVRFNLQKMRLQEDGSQIIYKVKEKENATRADNLTIIPLITREITIHLLLRL